MQSGGVIAGAVGGVVLGALSVYSIVILTHVEKHVASSGLHANRVTYPQLVATVLPHVVGGVNIHSLIVSVSIMVTCCGAVVAYALFIFDALPAVISSLELVSIASVLYLFFFSLAFNGDFSFDFRRFFIYIYT